MTDFFGEGVVRQPPYQMQELTPPYLPTCHGDDFSSFEAASTVNNEFDLYQSSVLVTDPLMQKIDNNLWESQITDQAATIAELERQNAEKATKIAKLEKELLLINLLTPEDTDVSYDSDDEEGMSVDEMKSQLTDQATTIAELEKKLAQKILLQLEDVQSISGDSDDDEDETDSVSHALRNQNGKRLRRQGGKTSQPSRQKASPPAKRLCPATSSTALALSTVPALLIASTSPQLHNGQVVLGEFCEPYTPKGKTEATDITILVLIPLNAKITKQSLENTLIDQSFKDNMLAFIDFIQKISLSLLKLIDDFRPMLKSEYSLTHFEAIFNSMRFLSLLRSRDLHSTRREGYNEKLQPIRTIIRDILKLPAEKICLTCARKKGKIQSVSVYYSPKRHPPSKKHPHNKHKVMLECRCMESKHPISNEISVEISSLIYRT
ncbi:MAG: hypothetical protein ABW189_04140 [Rickettsiales bacterium]